MKHVSWALALALVVVASSPAQQTLPDAPGFVMGFDAPPPPSASPLASPRLAAGDAGVMPVRALPCPPASHKIPDPQAAPAPAPNQNEPCAQQNQIRPFVNADKRILPLTVGQKAHLAFHDVSDPFNLLTIAGNSAYTVATYSHSPYGPGLKGFGRLSGYTFLQDATGETIGTFALSSAFHEEPRYFRMPHAPVFRRVVHAVSRVAIAQSDTGRNIPNYANLLGSPICAEISNLYVPGLATNSRATTERIFSGFLTEPIGTLIAEFLPDVASHIHVRVVIVQRYINQISGMPGTQMGQVGPGSLAEF